MTHHVSTRSESPAVAFVRIALLTTALLLALRAPAAGERFTERVELSYPVPAGAEISLENTNGDVTIESWAGGTVEIVAEKRLDSSDSASAREAFEKIEVVVREHSRGLDIETEYPRSSSGLFDWLLGRARNVSVRYTLRVPEDAEIDIETVNGDVRTLGAGAPQRLRSTNGRIEVVDARHGIDARTTNGRIEAEVATAPARLDVRLASTNGRLVLSLPADVAARIEARTTNGSIETEIPVTVRHSSGRRRLDGEINEGGPGSIELKTTNGGIRIAESRS